MAPVKTNRSTGFSLMKVVLRMKKPVPKIEIRGNANVMKAWIKVCLVSVNTP